MFWSGNYIATRELNFLLKEENVSLIQVLEADDILQECKADNPALIKFLTRPEILAELITLITEEPPRNVELAMQYRHANMACEVLTSHLSMLSDRLSLDEVQMNRLCDFLLKDPPLNPLLASYFSKTIEMLLVRNQKQDWYLYHIVCLRVLDFFRSRRDFLPNLLKHISTSAICDIFKYFIRLDQFTEIVLEWLDEHQFLDSLIQIVCGSYVPEELESSGSRSGDDAHNHREHADNTTTTTTTTSRERDESECRVRAQRAALAAAGNAAALLTELVWSGCAGESGARPRAGGELRRRLRGGGARALLQAAFTSPPRARRAALVHACRAVRALLHAPPAPHAPDQPDLPDPPQGGDAEDQVDVELAVAPHLPLLHNALLRDPQHLEELEDGEKDKSKDAPVEGEGEKQAGECGVRGGAVGQARVEVAALLAQLARAARDEVCCTMLTLGTPGVLIDMFFAYPDNNFLHSEVAAFIRNALQNPPYRWQYARHLVADCDVLTRFMDAFEDNENRRWSAGGGGVRAAYMGHLVSALRALSAAELPPAPPALAARWAAFREHKLRPLLQHHDTPLGGYHPPEIIYKLENMEEIMATNYDFSDMAATASMDGLADELNADFINELNMGGSDSMETPDFVADGLGLDNADKRVNAAKNNFLELASQRFDDDMWDSAPDGDDADEGEDAEEGDDAEETGGGGRGRAARRRRARTRGRARTTIAVGGGGCGWRGWRGWRGGRGVRGGLGGVRRRRRRLPARRRLRRLDHAPRRIVVGVVCGGGAGDGRARAAAGRRRQARRPRLRRARAQPAHRHERHVARRHRQHRQRQPRALLRARRRPRHRPRRPRRAAPAPVMSLRGGAARRARRLSARPGVPVHIL